MITDINFQSENLRLFGRLALVKDSKMGIIFLHGGGQSNAKRYEFLQKEFVKNKITSLAFDFRGCGKSGGDFEDGSLQKRVLDAKNALKFFLTKTNLRVQNIYIWGSSMGGHVACRLLEDFNFKGIILQSAAAYSEEAEADKLNGQFSRHIRRSRNWENSPAFINLQKFNGRKLVVYGQKDDVIPNDVKNIYIKAC